MSISVVIPTLGREEVLLKTIHDLRALKDPPTELLIIDQTQDHDDATNRSLREWNDRGDIRWVKRMQPSIPAAMNEGLRAATMRVVLFLDDDIIPDADLIKAHVDAHPAGNSETLVAGQVLQPGEEVDSDASSEAAFSFRSTLPRDIEEFMGGNFSVDRKRALGLGGFDENFTGAAYRFERDFADRWLEAGNVIRYEPSASLRHLRAERGGTRAYGSHLTTSRSDHSVGEYYYLLTSPRVTGRGQKMIQRFVRAPLTRHHLCRPWYIPQTLIAEARGWIRAARLRRAGRKLADVSI